MSSQPVERKEQVRELNVRGKMAVTWLLGQLLSSPVGFIPYLHTHRDRGGGRGGRQEMVSVVCVSPPTAIYCPHMTVTRQGSPYLPHYLHTGPLLLQLVSNKGWCGLWDDDSDGETQLPGNVGCSQSCITTCKGGAVEEEVWQRRDGYSFT